MAKRKEALDKYLQGCCQRMMVILAATKGRKQWFKFVKPAQLDDIRGDVPFDVFAG